MEGHNNQPKVGGDDGLRVWETAGWGDNGCLGRDPSFGPSNRATKKNWMKIRRGLRGHQTMN